MANLTVRTDEEERLLVRGVRKAGMKKATYVRHSTWLWDTKPTSRRSVFQERTH